MSYRRIPTIIIMLAGVLIAACGGSLNQGPTDLTTVLVWVPGGVPDDLTEAVSAAGGVARTTEVLGGILDLSSSTDAEGAPVDRTADGRTIPLDTLAYDPATFEAFTNASTAQTLSALGPGDAVLGATSARLRGIGVGGLLTLASGDSLTIRAVLDDDAIAAAEVVVSPETARNLGVGTRRFLLAHVERAPTEAVELVRSTAATDEPLRVVSTDGIPWKRHGDQVLPQAIVKDRFGEFSVRSAPDGTAWLGHLPPFDHQTPTADPGRSGVTRTRRHGQSEGLRWLLLPALHRGPALPIPPQLGHCPRPQYRLGRPRPRRGVRAGACRRHGSGGVHFGR